MSGGFWFSIKDTKNNENKPIHQSKFANKGYYKSLTQNRNENTPQSTGEDNDINFTSMESMVRQFDNTNKNGSKNGENRTSDTSNLSQFNANIMGKNPLTQKYLQPFIIVLSKNC